MKTIVLTRDSWPVRYYSWVNQESTWYNASWLARRHDSCSLNRLLIWLTIRTFVTAAVVFAASIFFGSGLWLILWFLFTDFSLLQYIMQLDGAAAVASQFLLALFGVVSLFAVVILAVLGIKFTQPSIVKWAKSHQPKSAESAISLYQSWKEKYCARLEASNDE